MYLLCDINSMYATSCISIDELPAKEQIICSRSFGERITDEQQLREAVCQYAERAAEKLRGERVLPFLCVPARSQMNRTTAMQPHRR